MSGQLAVVGLGPGDGRWLTPEAAGALAGRRGGLRLRPLSRRACPCARARRATPPTTARSCARAAAALGHAARGREGRDRLRRRSRRLRHGGGGVRGDRSRRRTTGARSISSSCPGVTAMLAVAARVGAPLGHDFCAISLSDNLKPWELIERRLDAAASRRLRDRALQSRLAGAAVAARRARWSACAGICPARRR